MNIIALLKNFTAVCLYTYRAYCKICVEYLDSKEAFAIVSFIFYFFNIYVFLKESRRYTFLYIFLKIYLLNYLISCIIEASFNCAN